VLEGSAVQAATGTARYLAAMLDRRGGDLNPLSLARGLAGAAICAGAAIHGGTTALGIEQAGSSWRVRTATGTAIAPHVVLATNGYTDDLWPPLRRSIVPVFGALIATAALPDELSHRVMPSRCVLYETGTVTVYYRVDGSGRLLMGGRGPMRDISAVQAVAHLSRYAHRLWPDLQAVPWTHAWGGRLAMTRDQYPHIHEPAPGIIACVGYNGRGVALGTAMGRQIATRIANPSTPFDMPISSINPIAWHGLWPIAVRAVIAGGRLRDVLGI
jgi:glycine/D-amino acid oxidase-like deaminating enzyme